MRLASFSISASSVSPSSARACPAEITPAATLRCTAVGKLSKRIVFEIKGRERPSFAANSSWVQLKSFSNCAYAAPSSSGFNWLRWIFSINASRKSSLSGVWRIITGMLFKPAALAARKRRSPIINSYLPAEVWRTTGGCKIPISFMEAINSFSALSSKTVLGCRGFGEIASIETSFCWATSLPATVSEVGISESKLVPSPPRFVLMQSLHRACN